MASQQVIDIAAEIRRRRPGIGVVKLHKLLYFAQGHHLATFDQPLFEDTVSAWDKGPVVGALWGHETHGEPIEPHPEQLDEAMLNTIAYVLSRYGQLSGAELIQLTHGQDPWTAADRRREPSSSAAIDRDRMRDYFRAIAADDDDDIPIDVDQISAWMSDVDAPPAAAERDSPEALMRFVEA